MTFQRGHEEDAIREREGDRSPFGDWRIRLGIVLGVLVFSAGMIVWSTIDQTPMGERNNTAAWWCITAVVISALGVSAISDRLKK